MQAEQKRAESHHQIFLPATNTITSSYASYVPAYVPDLVRQENKPHLKLHLRKPGRKITNWPLDPALAVYQVENKKVDPEPCLAFGGKRPPQQQQPPKTPPPRVVPPQPVRASSVRSPSPVQKKVKKPKRGHPLIVRVRLPQIESREPSEAGSELSIRPVSKLPLWVQEQKRKQEDATKQTKCWEKQLHSAEQNQALQVHKNGSRTTL